MVSSVLTYDARTGRAGTTLTPVEQDHALSLAVAGQLVGWPAVSTGGRGAGNLAAAEQAFLDQLRNTFIIAALLALALGLWLSVWISRPLSAPLAHVRQAARAFAAHQWGQRIPIQGADEVANVARAINHMAETLQGAEVQRRNFLADIAHELRTPLAVLQGNLQALPDGVYPLALGEIATVYDQSRLISRLVDDLGPVVQAAAETWAGVAQAQAVRLRQALPAPLPAVRADPARWSQF